MAIHTGIVQRNHGKKKLNRESLALDLLCAEGPKTITSALGRLEQRYYEDGSGEYRLLSQAQWSSAGF